MFKLNLHRTLSKKARAIATLLVLGVCAPAAVAEIDAAGLEFFENRIRPVLVEHCYKCHSAEAKSVKGALKLDTREDLLKGGTDGAVIVPGEPDRSSLIAAVRYEDKDLQMPPAKNGGKKLPDAVIADLERWVKMGAPYPETPAGKRVVRPWSFDPIRDPAPPAVKDAAWPKTSIDRFVLAKMDERSLQPAAPADARTLIRRATYDLTGLPPTPEEVATFEESSKSHGLEETYARLLDRLLASPRYGERWGRHWLDLVRYADTAGETADYPVPLAWRYRNYVIDAFNADKPYDAFLREQIAGDILARKGPREHYAERATATGFLAISRRFGFDSENYHHVTIQDTLDTLGQTVLGLSLGCARCHDHKFDPISIADYYALYGIFESTRYAFPGSEQKSKMRAMLPLLAPEESQLKWRKFDARVATLVNRLEQQKQAVPGGVLRSLHDPDGDFEMQAPAAGGSNGVLVAPWLWDGKISVTNAAQSPFKNLYPRGKVGAHVAGGAADYELIQALNPVRTRASGGVLHANVDFRVASSDAGTKGTHRLSIGARSGAPAFEMFITSDALSIRTGSNIEPLCTLKPNVWHNLQLALDLERDTVSGTLHGRGEPFTFTNKPFATGWAGLIDCLALDSRAQPGAPRAAIELDNIGVQSSPPTQHPAPASALVAIDAAALSAELQALVGIDGDLELQTDAAPPAAPWKPGPNSVVKISAAAQSPFRNIYGPGKLGIHMPNRGEYDGFIVSLSAVKAEKTDRIFAAFDFRCVSKEAGGDGTWRFYLGHGPGSSAAVELFFNAHELSRRSGDAREVAAPLQVGEWYQVQLTLDLKAKRYSGVLASTSGESVFGGSFASNWDGTIDTAFVDSYGHRSGVRPALDADNFVVRETALPSLRALAVQVADADATSRRAKVRDLRRQLGATEVDAEATRRELEQLLAQGPVEMTYGAVEGAPHNARLHLRGEPTRPGPEAPRGFLTSLGGGPLPPETEGSGRLELAQWLTRPDNPLTARVMANRIWQYHFGRGLVTTPNDFGVRGQPPTHPELLDHLATQFIRSGWSIKAMHRQIMLSATYQQSSTGAASAELLAGFPRRRLSAEELRDSILAISGELDPAPGREHPFPPPTSWGFSQHGPFNAVYDHDKRSVYLMTQRIKRHPFLALFDGADPNATTPDRRTTTVPTQALFFLNDPFVHAKSEKCASRLQAAAPDEPQRIALAHRLVLGRAPSAMELKDGGEFLAEYRAELAAAGQGNPELRALAAYVRTLFGSNEFLHID